MSRDAEAFRRFATIVDAIENDVGVVVAEVNVEYATDDDGALFSAMSELMGGSTRRPRFKFVVEPQVDDTDEAFEALADVAEIIEDDVDATVLDARSGTYEYGGGLFSSTSERLAFGLIVDVEAALEEDVEDVDEDGGEDESEPTATAIKFSTPAEGNMRDDEEVDSE